MFMKNYKKSVATLMTTITLFAGLHGDVFAKEAQCYEVYHNKLEVILKCKIDDQDFIVASKNHHMGGISIIQVK